MSKPGITNNPSGRPLGAAAKRSVQLTEEAEECNASPGKLLIKIISGEKTDICGEPVTKEDWKWALSELFPYVAGKRKPVDSMGDDTGLTLDSIFEAVNAVK